MSAMEIIMELPLKQLRKLKSRWARAEPGTWEAQAFRVIAQELLERQ